MRGNEKRRGIWRTEKTTTKEEKQASAIHGQNRVDEEETHNTSSRKYSGYASILIQFCLSAIQVVKFVQKIKRVCSEKSQSSHPAYCNEKFIVFHIV
jgi:hypothetical protein